MSELSLLTKEVMETAHKDGRIITQEDAQLVAAKMQQRQDRLDDAMFDNCSTLTEAEIKKMDAEISELYFKLSRRVLI